MSLTLVENKKHLPFALGDYLEEKRREQEKADFERIAMNNGSSAAATRTRQTYLNASKLSKDLEDASSHLEKTTSTLTSVRSIYTDPKYKSFAEELSKQEERLRNQHADFYSRKFKNPQESSVELKEISKEVKQTDKGSPLDVESIKGRVGEVRGGVYFTANHLLAAEKAIVSIQLKDGQLPHELSHVLDEIRRSLKELSHAEKDLRRIESSHSIAKENREEKKRTA